MMKSAEEWVEVMFHDGDRNQMEGHIRAIQDDAWEDGRKHSRGPRSDAQDELDRAGSCMFSADQEIAKRDFMAAQQARDNAAEHRKIAEAYIALAQAMKP